MPERVVGLGGLSENLPAKPWVLVFGGVTREGNRRARRAARAALGSDVSVLWFDGFGERMEHGDSDRVELDADVPDGLVVVVDYADEEQHHWLNRVVNQVPLAIVGSVERIEDELSWRRPIRFLTRIRRQVQKGLVLFQVKVLRRIAQIFRGLVGWRMVSHDVGLLAELAPPPSQIIYGDDFALTQGWRAARLWPDVPTAMELQEE